MKHISALALSVMATATISAGANAATVPLARSNGVITNNIATMQHTIMLNAFDNFDGSMAITNGDYLANRPRAETCQPVYTTTYCDGDMYGDAPTARASGHSGGETMNSGYYWIDWRHAQDKAEFKDFDKMESNYDLISLGFASDPEEFSNGFSQYGGFGGVAIAREKSDNVKLEENGGYFGLYRAYHIGGFNIAGAADAGLLFSDTKSAITDYDFTNFWLGAAINTSYNIRMGNSFTLQPGVYLGYTWIYSDGYESATGSDISIDSAHMFEVSPSLRALFSFGGDWYAAASARYVFNFNAGGDTKVAGAKIPELELKDYIEYGLSIEKDIERFSMAISLYRHDGGLTGWAGGVQLRYAF